MNGVIINELPKFIVYNPDEATRTLQVTDPLDDDSTLTIPFYLHVNKTYFSVRKTMVT